VLVGPDGCNPRAFALRWHGADPRVVVGTANRVVVRLSGAFRTDEGKAVSELILFVEMFRQCPEIRLQPVFIYLGDPREDLVGSLTLTVHTPLGGPDASYTLANERGRGYADPVQPFEGGPHWWQARVLQLGSSYYRIEKRVGAEGSWVKASEGRRCQGWCRLQGATAVVTAATRHFWQEYPRSLEIDARSGTITFGLWPCESVPLDLRRYSPTAYGNIIYETRIEGLLEDGENVPADFGAVGIAKSHELMLRFDATDAPDAPQGAVRFCRPVRLMSDPVHFAATRVVGRLTAPTPDRRPQAESAIAEVMDFLAAERDRRGWYGQMDFGDIMTAYYADKDRWAFDDGGYGWINTEHIPDYGFWISALRSGRSDWLAAAVEMSRHNRDVDLYHRGPLRGFGSRHNVNHWGCMCKEWRISMPLVRRLHYYVTADPWTREVIENVFDAIRQRMRDARAPRAIEERTSPAESYARAFARDCAPRTAPDVTSVLACLLVRWELSGDAADGAAVAGLCDAFARCVRPDGQFIRRLRFDVDTGQGGPEGDEPIPGRFFMNVFGGQHVLVEIAEMLDHAALSDALVRHARWQLQSGQGDPACAVQLFLAFACRRTGEEGFRRAIAQAIQDHQVTFRTVGGSGPLDNPPHPVLPDARRKNKIACTLMDFPLLAPYGLAVLE